MSKPTKAQIKRASKIAEKNKAIKFKELPIERQRQYERFWDAHKEKR